MSAVNIYVVHMPKENLNFLILLTLQLSFSNDRHVLPNLTVSKKNDGEMQK